MYRARKILFSLVFICLEFCENPGFKHTLIHSYYRTLYFLITKEYDIKGSTVDRRAHSSNSKDPNNTYSNINCTRTWIGLHIEKSVLCHIEFDAQWCGINSNITGYLSVVTQ